MNGPHGPVVKTPACQAGIRGSIPRGGVDFGMVNGRMGSKYVERASRYFQGCDPGQASNPGETAGPSECGNRSGLKTRPLHHHVSNFGAAAWLYDTRSGGMVPNNAIPVEANQTGQAGEGPARASISEHASRRWTSRTPTGRSSAGGSGPARRSGTPGAGGRVPALGARR